MIKYFAKLILKKLDERNLEYKIWENKRKKELGSNQEDNT